MFALIAWFYSIMTCLSDSHHSATRHRHVKLCVLITDLFTVLRAKIWNVKTTIVHVELNFSTFANLLGLGEKLNVKQVGAERHSCGVHNRSKVEGVMAKCVKCE